MSLADFQPPCPFTTFSRSLTFPNYKSFRVQERVRQISGHLARSSTLATSRSDTNEDIMARGTAPSAAAENDASKEQITRDGPPREGFKRCAVCKADTVPVQPGGLDSTVPDKYNQLIPAPSPPLKQHPEFRHCMPPEAPVYGHFSLFTAGSIEMGAAVQWQQRLADHLRDLPITMTNPRRGKWDPNVDAKRSDAAFFNQVEWELDALTHADVICYFFDCATVSPVTLMELGLWAHSGKIIVCCDQRYWRQGNVEIVCERYNIPYVSSFKALVPAVREMMTRKGLQVDAHGNFCGKGTGQEKVETRPGVTKQDMWWKVYADSNEDRRAKGLPDL
ncbi:hypothetical protein BDU57DRAFT_531331 [Ampelomyces quisqualis]|uniref:Uncharacterized protein n=1 Tax=Ampelomyces quisqualis TaxID=50730 RepID=A0A6A5QH88_AMPQU|nr:hypothetical protein BDU57DRAFT_531331 [Ampelomyces quisqualis]